MEYDDEIQAGKNSYTTEFRQYDPRLGRWKSLDPLMKMFPSLSPYVGFDNNPIYYTDPYGLASEGGDGGKLDGSEGDPLNLPTGDKRGPGMGGDHGESVIIIDKSKAGTTGTDSDGRDVAYAHEGLPEYDNAWSIWWNHAGGKNKLTTGNSYKEFMSWNPELDRTVGGTSVIKTGQRVFTGPPVKSMFEYSQSGVDPFSEISKDIPLKKVVSAKLDQAFSYMATSEWNISPPTFNYNKNFYMSSFVFDGKIWNANIGSSSMMSEWNGRVNISHDMIGIFISKSKMSWGGYIGGEYTGGSGYKFSIVNGGGPPLYEKNVLLDITFPTEQMRKEFISILVKKYNLYSSNDQNFFYRKNSLTIKEALE